MPPPKRTTVGLINRGNDCFANANLQALAGLPSLYSYLHQLQFLCPDRDSSLLLLSKTLYSLIVQLNEPVFVAKSVSIQPLVAAIEYIHSSYLSRSQHDAHELLHLVLETLQTEQQKLRARVSGVPQFAFEGTTIDTIKCFRCGLERNSPQASFLVLTLAVPRSRYSDVQKLLDDSLERDIISDYNCQKCRILEFVRKFPDRAAEFAQYVDGSEDVPDLPLPPVSSPMEKSTKFTQVPETLAVHLNRSIYSGGAQRNSCKVSIPEYLEVPCGSTTRRYKLCSVLRHSGTHMSGHYECARRKNYDFWRKQTAQFEEPSRASERVSLSPSYPASIRSLRSLSSFTSISSEDSDLPWPPPASAKASVQSVSAVANSAPSSPRMLGLSSRTHKGPKFWSISDTVVKENTLAQAVGSQSANYLVFYERVADRQTDQGLKGVLSSVSLHLRE